MSEHIVRARVEEITPLTDTITRLVLTPEHYVAYQAGQYLQILFAGQAPSYSIANAPLGAHKYELHIRHGAHAGNCDLFAYIKEHGEVTIRLPLGHCHIDKLHPSRPIIFIAGGTGFAPVKAMIEQLLADSDARSFELFWGTRSRSDLYMDEKIINWQAHVSHFRYFSLPAGDNKEILLASVLEKHADDLLETQMVISGPFDMVYSARDILVARGISPSHLFSDAFEFE